VFPSVIYKLRLTKAHWLGTFYLTAPNPFHGFTFRKKIKFPNLYNIIYYLSQRIAYLFLQYAECILVTSSPDLQKFPQQYKKGNYFIVKGGVNLKNVNLWKKRIGKSKKKYDGVFMGRLHEQKGVIELIEIWKRVTKKLPDAKLVIIGNGPHYSEVQELIIILNIQRNVELKGYLIDSEEKYRIFAESKLFLHTSIYDSGGMSAAEAMAWGIPAIAFDLDSLKTYYPAGVEKVPVGDTAAFADTIMIYLKNQKKYKKLQGEAIHLIKNEWDWEKRTAAFLAMLKTKKILYS